MEQIVQLDPHPWKCLSVVSPGISCQLASAGMDISVAAIANPAMPIAHAKSSFFTLRSPQKYTQHLLSGTPAFHDHAHVGVRSHAGATSNQSPSFCKGMRGVPLTSDITGGPLGSTRTFSSSACAFTTPIELCGGFARCA